MKVKAPPLEHPVLQRLKRRLKYGPKRRRQQRADYLRELLRKAGWYKKPSNC
jgi:hypothetical protein